METLEQSALKKMPVLHGKEVVLLPFLDLLDMGDFVRLHQEDKRGYMCRFCLKNLSFEQSVSYIEDMILRNDIYIWGVHVKNERAGFIYLSNMTDHSASVNGIMDKRFAKSISREDRKKKFSYADDATRTVVHACFEKGFVRIEGDATSDNREAIALHKRLGFKQEGRLRKAVEIDGKYKDVIIVSLLKGEIQGE